MRKALLIYSFIISVIVALILPYILQVMLTDTYLMNQYPMVAGLTFAIVWGISLVTLFTGIKFISTKVGLFNHYDLSHTDGLNREDGVVKWFNVTKGFGFITRDSGEDVFVHFRSIRGEGHRSLQDGQKVSFNVIESDKGIQADDVTVVEL
jgi:CspA family cold shock protein